MNRKLQILVGLPKTIYFNLCCFDFKTAIRLPILLSHDVKLGKLRKGVIILNNFSGGGVSYNLWDRRLRSRSQKRSQLFILWPQSTYYF